MRLAVLLALAGCYTASTTAPKQPPPTPIAIADPRVPCAKAALGIQNGTRALRPPDVPIADELQAHCIEDGWSADAIACFAEMPEGNLAHCAVELADDARDRMLAVVGGDVGPRTTVAIARRKLATLKVGVAACDDFIATVARLLACDAMPIEERAQLGAETADFWSLPTSGLPPDAERRMGAVCGKSLSSLQQRAAGAGCMP